MELNPIDVATSNLNQANGNLESNIKGGAIAEKDKGVVHKKSTYTKTTPHSTIQGQTPNVDRKKGE